MTIASKPRTEPTVTLKPDDLVLLGRNNLGDVPLARLVSIEFDAAGQPEVYWVRHVNAAPRSEPQALKPNDVVQIFQGVLDR